MNLTSIVIGAAVLVYLPAAAQGTFRNLDFESAIPISLPGDPFRIATSNGIPGWTAYLGTNAFGVIFFNTVSIGGAAVSLQSSTSSSPAIAGNYSVLLQSSSGLEPTSAGVGQVGQIPWTAMSLRFYGAAYMQVTFAGQLLSLVQLGSGPGYHIVGADISAFAGQTGELRFVVPRYGFPRSESFLDNIEFSTEVIPEPNASWLVGLAILLAATRIIWHRPRKLRE